MPTFVPDQAVSGPVSGRFVPDMAPQFRLPPISDEPVAATESSLDFVKRVHPELIESADAANARQAKALATPISIKITDSATNVPEAFGQAQIGQVFADERHGLIRKISDTNYEPIKPGFVADVGNLIRGVPQAIMSGQFSPIEESVRNIASNPDARALAASIGSTVAAARLGAPLGPEGMALTATQEAVRKALPGMFGAALAEPYVQSQIPSTGTESALRVAAGGLAEPIQLFDQLALKTGPRVATALEQGMIGSGIGTAQVLGNAAEQRRLPTPEEMAMGPTIGALMGGTMGFGLGGRRNIPVGEPAPQEIFMQSPVKLPEPIAPDILPSPVSPAPRGVVRPVPAGASFNESETARAGRALMELPGEPVRGVANQTPVATVNDLGDTAVSAAIKEVEARMAAVPTPEQKLAILKQELQLRGESLSPDEKRLWLDAQHRLDNEIAAKNIIQERQDAAQKAADEQQKAVEAQQKVVEQAQTEQQKALQEQQKLAEEAQQPLLQPKQQNLANKSAQTAGMSKKNDNINLQASLNEISGPKLAEPVAPVDIGPRDATVSTGNGVPTTAEQAMLAEQQRLVNEHLASKPSGEGEPPASAPIPSNPILPEPVMAGGAAAPTHDVRITHKDSQEIQHKLGILADEADLQESYGLTAEQAQALYQTIPFSGGEWKIPSWGFKAVIGELEDHANILRGMADDARSENLTGQAMALNRQAIRMENFADSIKKGEPTEPLQDPERIVSAAVKTQDGTVFTGRVHAGAFNTAEESGKRLGDMPDQGFVTSSGRFVSREEAAKIAESSAQVPKGFSGLKGPGREMPLGAEDLDLPKHTQRQVFVGLSAQTGTIPGLNKLAQEAAKGSKESAAMLREVANDSLRYLTSGAKSVKIESEPVTGMFGGQTEPSNSIRLTFDEADRPQVLAALAKFGENFNQEQVHVRSGADANTSTGHVYPDGSFNTPVFRWILKAKMSKTQLKKLANQAGVDGFTTGDNYLEIYNTTHPSNDNAITNFVNSAQRVTDALGERAETVQEARQRLWIYGSGDSAIPYREIRGNISPEAAEGSVTAHRVAQRLAGRPLTPAQPAKAMTPEQASVHKSIARSFENDLKVDNLADPKVRRAYDELAKEVKSQYESLPIKVEILSGSGEPYANSAAMRKDLLDNNHLSIFGTDANNFGPRGTTYPDHPLLRDSGLKDANGQPLLYNDLLRAVHDYYAHGQSAAQFGPLGEEAAWLNHMMMTKSPWARWALTSETRGQNSVVNFGKNAAHNKANPKDTIYAEQKADLLPIKYAKTGDTVLDAEMDAIAGTPPGAKLAEPAPREPFLEPVEAAPTLPEPSDLPPPAMMRSPALKAELKAKGVTVLESGVSVDNANAAQLMNAVGKLRSQRGAISTQAIAPLSGAAVGGVGGFALTERQPGESDAEFQARRLANAGLGAAAGLAGGSAVGALSKIRLHRAPLTSNPELSTVRKMLSPAEEKPKGMFETIKDAAFDFLTRANTNWAPLEKLQRNVYKLVNRPFQSGSYYDLADRGESIAGAVVHAQREAGLLADLVNNLPKELRPRFSEFLVLNRIRDRLQRIPVEAAKLQDAVGMAQAEVQAAKSKFADSKTLANAQAVNNRRAELSKAIEELNMEADRLRVAGWSLDNPKLNSPVRGIEAMQQEIGPEAYAKLEEAGQEFQSLMLANLRRQVDSGRMPEAVFQTIADSSDFYAPFKVMKHYEEASAPVYSGGGRSVVNVQPITKRITGIDDAELKLANPLEPAFEQIYKGTLLAEKNRFLREISTLTILDKKGEFIRMLGPEEPARKGFKEIPFFRNGEVVRMEVADDVHEALTSPSSWAEKSVVLNSLKAGSTLFKMGATALQAPFQIKNAFIYDPARLAIMSKYGIKNPVDAMNFVFRDYPVGMWSAFRTSMGHPNELGEKWLSSGAANSTFARVMNPQAFAKTLPKEQSALNVVWHNQFGLVPLNNAAAIVSSILEQSAKITGLKRALRFENLEELSPVQRERKWREVVHEIRNYAGSPDFNRMGTDMGIINVLAPFTNARWQGFVADAGRLVGTDRAGVNAKIRLATLVGLPAAGLMLWNLRPENRKDWEQIPESERMRGFYVPVYQDKAGKETVLPSNMDGSQNAPKYFKDRQGRDLRQYYVIPKREMPQMMGNTTEDFVRWMETNDPKSFDGLASNLLNVAAPVSLQGRNSTEMAQSMLSGVNPVVRTPMEVALNRDMYRQKNIIPEGRVGALQARPDLAFAPGTPDVYKTIAGMVPDFAPAITRSPAVAQKAIEDFTGGFPRQFINPKDKPEQTGFERVTRSFRRSENVDLTDTENAIDVAKGESTALRSAATDTASQIVKAIIAMDDPQRAQVMVQHGIQSGVINEEAYKEIVQQLKEHQLHYTPEQSQASRLSKRERAFYYHERLKEMKPEDAQVYIQEAIAKRLIDSEVGQLMMQLK